MSPLAVLALVIAAAATVTDLRARWVPDRLTGLAAVGAVVLGWAVDPAGEPGRVVAGLGAGGFLLAAAVARPGGMGLGDVKLAGVLGLCLGVADVALAVLVALGCGTLVGLAVAARDGVTAARVATLPFAPCLGIGAVVAAASAG